MMPLGFKRIGGCQTRRPEYQHPIEYRAAQIRLARLVEQANEPLRKTQFKHKLYPLRQNAPSGTLDKKTIAARMS